MLGQSFYFTRLAAQPHSLTVVFHITDHSLLPFTSLAALILHCKVLMVGYALIANE